MSSGSACWILWLTPMDWLALSIGRSGSQPLEYSCRLLNTYGLPYTAISFPSNELTIKSCFVSPDISTLLSNSSASSFDILKEIILFLKRPF